jgi:hypothetical protein
MATLGNQASVLRTKPGEKGAAGRFTLLTEVARGYLGTLWVGRDSNQEPYEAAYVRHMAPLVSAGVREALLAGASWAKASGVSDELEVLEGRTSIDVVSPFVDAEPFRSLLRLCALKHAAPPEDVLVGIAKDLLAQIAWVNGRAAADGSAFGFGGVHPDSILVGIDGGVHLLDAGAAGAAWALEPFRSDPQRVGYFAPEQVEAQPSADARTDVFALGVILWEALSNRRLFPGNDAKMTREKVLRAQILRLDATRPTGMPGISTELADLIARALERDPARRFQNVGEMEQAFASLEGASPDRIRDWVLSLADAAIAKRRQILERAPGSAHASGTHQAVAVNAPQTEPEPPVAAASPESGERPTTPRFSEPTTVPEGLGVLPDESTTAASEPVPAASEPAVSAAEPSSEVHEPAVAVEEKPRDTAASLGAPEAPGETTAADAEEPLSEAEIEAPETRITAAPPPPSMRQSLLPLPARRPSLAPRPPAGEEFTSALPPATEQLAGPMHTTALASLTAPAKSDRRKPLILGIAALLTLAALGVGLSSRRHAAQESSTSVVETPTPTTAETKAAAEPEKVVVPEPVAEAKPAVAEPAAAPNPAPLDAPTEKAPSAGATEKPKIAVSHADVPALREATARHVAPSHLARNSGYKPGGI